MPVLGSVMPVFGSSLMPIDSKGNVVGMRLEHLVGHAAITQQKKVDVHWVDLHLRPFTILVTRLRSDSLSAVVACKMHLSSLYVAA